jgi:glycosyltransferase involved in cell wall biosynthesis
MLKMKILFIANNIPVPKRKSNRIILTIAEKLAAHCDISFVFPTAAVFPPFSFMKKYKAIAGLHPWKDGNFTIRPARYLRLPGKRLSYLLADTIRADNFVNRQHLPDLCHAHYIMPDGYVALKIKQKYNIPYVVSIRGADIRHVHVLHDKGFIFKKFLSVLQHADKIVVHNRPQQEFVMRLGFDSVMIPHGIEADRLRPEISKADTPVTVATVAELIRRKNVEWVIRAVKDYRGAADLRLVIAGDGIYRDELQRMAADASNIRFTGHISRAAVDELLTESHIFALPAVNETFGLVYVEAAAKKNAVIGHKDEGVDGAFEDGKEMFFCRSYEEFTEMLRNLADNNILRNKLADAAFAKVQQYVWDKIIRQYIKTYQQCIT